MSPGLTSAKATASTPPVPDAVIVTTFSFVWKRYLPFCVMPSRRAVNSGDLWLIIGFSIALMTLSETLVGPGIIRSFFFSPLVEAFAVDMGPLPSLRPFKVFVNHASDPLHAVHVLDHRRYRPGTSFSQSFISKILFRTLVAE